MPNKTLLPVILVAFACGMFWPWWFARRSNAPAQALQASAVQAPAVAVNPAQTNSPNRETTRANIVAPLPREPEPAAIPTALNDAIPAVSPTHRTSSRFVPGTIAYLRCDGVPQRPGLYPCPRTEAFESLVFARLAQLADCSELANATGQGDLALTFTGATLSNVAFRDRFPSTVARLPSQAVLSCLGQKLADVVLETQATRSVVSFRFALQP